METFELEVHDGVVVVTFTQVEYDDSLLLDEAIARLDRMIAMMEEYFEGQG